MKTSQPTQLDLDDWMHFDVWANIMIRGARIEDLAKLEWFGAYAHFRDLYQRTWRDHVAGRRLMMVADLNAFPVGQVWVDVTPHSYAYLYALRVMEPLQGLGIGSALIDTAVQIARAKGYRVIQLAVERRNANARRLYERHGFHIFTQRVDHWSYTDHHGMVQWVQEDVYGMEKEL
jgi:ribosomal protein S18 acetylase RimI-like enzyme